MSDFDFFTHDFDGATYDPARDHTRLSCQLSKVYNLMCDSKWRTLADIVQVVGGSEAAVSARLRDLRKAKFGKHIVDRRYISKGLYEYRLVV